MAYFDLAYVSVGCNQTPHTADWNLSGVLAYGAGNSIALAQKGKADVILEKIVCMLHGHTGRVNCVRWIVNDLLASGAVDKNVIIWKCVDQANLKYEVDEVLTSHSGPVICVAGIYQDSSTIVVSGSSDSTLKLWERKDSSSGNVFQLLQTLSFGLGFVLGFDFHIFENNVILACGTEVGNVEIYTKQNDQLVKVISLEGHEDWVRDVHFTEEGDSCLLASCSQDTSIRLWKLCRKDPYMVDKFDDLKVSENCFIIPKVNQDGIERKYVFTLESVLIGHDEWVYSVRWQPKHGSEPPCLLSASMDKTMVLWTLDTESDLWIEQVRVGDVGGNSLGLYGAVFGPDGNYILAHGYQGAFHLWKKITSDHWQSIATISGHYDHVQDISWEPNGEFLVSVSTDQTTRIHAPWVHKGCGITWREIARPQIHGYNLQCICMLSPVLFVSGADEKVLRVFHCPKKFVDNLLSISKVDLNLDHTEFPTNASVPSLGLSNKAEFEIESPGAVSTISQSSVDLTEAPFEGQLQNTLWPEIHKLYGHSYEIFCVANSPDGKFVASACMASKQEYASILIWETSQWQQVQALCHHTLTVTQLSFSHSSELLLAVSRDRTWSLWRKTKESDGPYILESKLDKHIHSHVHSRIIWSCSWTHDDAYFATGSRDKKVILWSLSTTSDGHQDVVSLQGIKSEEAVTAVNFAPFEYKNKYLLAVGLESGAIHAYNCYKMDTGVTMCRLIVSVDTSLCHTSAVKQLSWRPTAEHGISLASCSLDHCIKIFEYII